MKFIITLAMLITSFASARVNEDLPALSKRYGEPVFRWTHPTNRIVYVRFEFQDRLIDAVLFESKCVLECINLPTSYVYSSEQASELTREAADFFVGLLTRAYEWPDDKARQALATLKAQGSLEYNGILAKFSVDHAALQNKNTFKADCMVQSSRMRDEAFRETVARAFSDGVDARLKANRAKAAPGF
jgi:hypothetical protein